MRKTYAYTRIIIYGQTRFKDKRPEPVVIREKRKTSSRSSGGSGLGELGLGLLLLPLLDGLPLLLQLVLLRFE